MSDITKMNAPHCDYIGVDRFATAMKKKLRLKAEQGRGGWNRPHECRIDNLLAMLVDHFEDGCGDMIDIANFAMMIWNRQHPKG